MLSTVEWRVTKGKRDGTFGISGEKGKIKWHGSKSMVPEHQPSGDFNYVVAVYNKRSKKIELFDTQCNSVTPMSQRVDVGDAGMKNISLSHMNMREQRAVLTHSFGSRMARKGLKNLELNAVTEDNIVGLDEIEQHLIDKGDEVSEKYTQAGMQTEADIALEQNRRRLLPFFDTDATEASKAYPFENMLSTRESHAFDTLIVSMEDATNEEKVQALRNSETVEWRENILRRLPKVHNRLEGASNKAKRVVEFQKLLYQQCLQKFYRLGNRIKVKGSVQVLAEKIKVPSIILEKFLVKFSDRKKMEGGGYGGNLENDDEETAVYYRSQFHTTKLILEICVVTLMVENYRNYDPAYLAKDLRLTVKDVIKFLKETGAKCERIKPVGSKSKRTPTKIPGRGEYLVRLPVPLSFPKMSRGRKN
eukprot:g2737.t1